MSKPRSAALLLALLGAAHASTPGASRGFPWWIVLVIIALAVIVPALLRRRKDTPPARPESPRPPATPPAPPAVTKIEVRPVDVRPAPRGWLSNLQDDITRLRGLSVEGGEVTLHGPEGEKTAAPLSADLGAALGLEVLTGLKIDSEGPNVRLASTPSGLWLSEQGAVVEAGELLRPGVLYGLTRSAPRLDTAVQPAPVEAPAAPTPPAPVVTDLDPEPTAPVAAETTTLPEPEPTHDTAATIVAPPATEPSPLGSSRPRETPATPEPTPAPEPALTDGFSFLGLDDLALGFGDQAPGSGWLGALRDDPDQLRAISVDGTLVLIYDASGNNAAVPLGEDVGEVLELPFLTGLRLRPTAVGAAIASLPDDLHIADEGRPLSRGAMLAQGRQYPMAFGRVPDWAVTAAATSLSGHLDLSAFVGGGIDIRLRRGAETLTPNLDVANGAFLDGDLFDLGRAYGLPDLEGLRIAHHEEGKSLASVPGNVRVSLFGHDVPAGSALVPGAAYRVDVPASVPLELTWQA